MSQDNNTTKSNQAMKAGLWYTVSSIAVKAIAILTTPIFTRMMSSEDYGIVNTFVSWQTLLLIFCSLNLTYSIGRAKLDFPNKLNEYVGAMQTLSAIVTVTIGIMMLVFVKPLASFMEINESLIMVLAFYLLFEPTISFTQSRFRYQYKYKSNISIAIYVAVASVALTLFLMLFFKEDRYYAKILGSVIPNVLLAVVFWFWAIKQKNINCNVRYWKYGLGISLPLIFHSVSLNVLSLSDRILITKYSGNSATAIYSLAYAYAVLINIVLNSVNEAWLPWFHDTYHSGEESSIKKNVKPLIVLGGMLGVGCIATAPEAMYILGPAEYQAGKWAVAPIALGVFCQFVYQQYVHIELHLKKTKFISAGTMIAAVLNLGLNIYFIPRFGFVAAAYTTLFCYFVLMFVHLFITKYILHVKLYDDKFMFIAVGVVGMISAGFMYTYEHILLRYALLFILCMAYLYTNRKFIIGFLSKKKK